MCCYTCCGLTDRQCMYIRTIIAVIGILAGLAVFIVFNVVYHNASTAWWGGLSGVLAAVSLVMVKLRYNESFAKKPQAVRAYMPLMCLGILFMLTAVTGFIVYLVLVISNWEDIKIGPKGFSTTLAMCFLTFKWATTITYMSNGLRKQYGAHDHDYRPIIHQEAAA